MVGFDVAIVRVGIEEGKSRVRIATMDGGKPPYRLRKRGFLDHLPDARSDSDALDMLALHDSALYMSSLSSSRAPFTATWDSPVNLPLPRAVWLFSC